MLYYTADLHIGHANIIKMCRCPFSDVEEMNDVLICNWNDSMTNADTVTLFPLLLRNRYKIEAGTGCMCPIPA